MLTASAGAELQANVSGFPSGLGNVGVQILDPAGAVISARTNVGVLEIPAGSGNYAATIVAPVPGNYLVFWDQGTITPTTSWAEPLTSTVAVAPVPLDPRLTWLRRMVEDLSMTEAELITAPGTGASEFFVSNPPIVSAPHVTVAGVPLATPGQFSYTTFSVVLNSAPAQGSPVTIRYARTTFDDVELAGYINAALSEYTADQHVVYKAAIYAIDTLLVGAATSLDFGSGQESFQMSSVFNRLLQLRNAWQAWLDINVENARITIGDLMFDSLDPRFPPSFDPNSIDYSSDAPTGAPRGMPGAFLSP